MAKVAIKLLLSPTRFINTDDIPLKMMMCLSSPVMNYGQAMDKAGYNSTAKGKGSYGFANSTYGAGNNVRYGKSTGLSTETMYSKANSSYNDMMKNKFRYTDPKKALEYKEKDSESERRRRRIDQAIEQSELERMLDE